MKRLIMMLLLVALAIPATAFAAPAPNDGPCSFTKNDKNKTWSLVADCTTNTTIKVPNGYTLNGNALHDHRRRQRALPPGSMVRLLQNEATTMYVKNLKIDGREPPRSNSAIVSSMASRS